MNLIREVAEVVSESRYDDVTAQRSKLECINAHHAQHHRELPAMMNIVRHDSPYRPLSRIQIILASPPMGVSRIEIGYRPLVKDALNRMPRQFQPFRQSPRVISSNSPFNDMANSVRVGLPLRDALCDSINSRSSHSDKPIDSTEADVPDDLAEGTTVCCSAPDELLVCKRGYGVHEAGLVSFPTPIDVGK